MLNVPYLDRCLINWNKCSLAAQVDDGADSDATIPLMEEDSDCFVLDLDEGDDFKILDGRELSPRYVAIKSPFCSWLMYYLWTYSKTCIYSSISLHL